MLKYRTTWHLVRDFMFSIVNKEFLIFLFFLALSGVFWLLTALNETYEKEYTFEVSLAGVPRNVVLTGDLEDTVRVTIKDKGFTLLAYSYSDMLHKLQFRFSQYSNERTGRGQIPIADAQKQIYQQLYGSSKVTSIKPDKLAFYFNYGISKKVPVRFEGSVKSAASYYLAQIKIIPESVKVYAIKETLDSITYMSTEDVMITNLTDTIERRVKLRHIKGVKIIPERVNVKFYPDILTEYEVEVPINAVNVPAGKTLRTFPSRVKVKFTIGASMVRSLKEEDFRVEADYSELTTSQQSDKCQLHIKAAPHNISHPRLEFNRVDYLIEQ